MIERVTLDTNVVLDLWRDDPRWRPEVERLLELAAAGAADLAVTRHIREDVQGKTARRLTELPELGIVETGGLLILDESDLGGWDNLGDEAVLGLEVQMAAVAAALGGPKPPEPQDWRLLHAHKAQGRHTFLTRDGRILRIADDLLSVGIVVYSPRKYLALRDEPVQPDSPPDSEPASA